MGLDIFHAHAKHEADTTFCSVGDFLSQLTPLRSYFKEHENPHIDWEKMFADRGLVYRDHRVVSRVSDGRHTCFFFVDADAVGFQHPIRAVFSDEQRSPLLPKFMKRSKFQLPASRHAPHFFGPFDMTMKTETVIFYDVAGYQRGGVSDEFYRHFRPDDVTCVKDHAYAIYQSAIPEAQQNFKRNFLDNWIEGRSFVLISY
jgi:hypothetical protein